MEHHKSKKDPNMTSRVRLYFVAHGAICASIASLLATIIGGGASPMLSMFLTAVLFFGNAKYGPRYPNNGADLKAGILASLTSPYLFWKELDQKFQTPTETVYDAYVNEVHVGTLSDADYRRIQRSVLRDPRPYVAQALNIGWVVFKAFDTLFIAVPVLVFWGMIALAIYEPSFYTQILATVQQGPIAIHDGVLQYLGTGLQLYLMVYAVKCAIFVRVPGFENKFGHALTRLLRRHLGVAAEGSVTLTAPAMFESALSSHE